MLRPKPEREVPFIPSPLPLSNTALITHPHHRTFFLSLILLAIALLVALYVYVLPYYFSPQKPLLRGVPLSGEFNTNETVGTFHGQTFPSLFQDPLADIRPETNVLGYPSQKHIEVDLTNQRLYAIENGQRVYDFLVSTGKWGRTPTGVFKIWTKLRYTRMEGGNPALNTYYNLPNVPFTMFFANNEVPAHRGFGIHGTYWHNNFGTPMSHGCINLKTEEAGLLYYWAEPVLPGEKKSIRADNENPGTTVIIYGKAP